jgi:hypothetical protein
MKHYFFDRLTEDEQLAVGEGYKALTAEMLEIDGSLKIASDDRAERVIDAIACAILETRMSKKEARNAT